MGKAEEYDTWSEYYCNGCLAERTDGIFTSISGESTMARASILLYAYIDSPIIVSRCLNPKTDNSQIESHSGSFEDRIYLGKLCYSTFYLG